MTEASSTDFDAYVDWLRRSGAIVEPRDASWSVDLYHFDSESVDLSKLGEESLEGTNLPSQIQGTFDPSVLPYTPTSLRGNGADAGPPGIVIKFVVTLFLASLATAFVCRVAWSPTEPK